MMDSYLRPLLRKGVPSLFVSIKDLYSDISKRQVIESLALDYVSNLKAHQSFSKPELPDPTSDSSNNQPEGDSKEAEEFVELEPPSALLWSLYFLAQHFDYCGQSVKALEYINAAISHTPTLVELLMTKARILKVLISSYIFFKIKQIFGLACGRFSKGYGSYERRSRKGFARPLH